MSDMKSQEQSDSFSTDILCVIKFMGNGQICCSMELLNAGHKVVILSKATLFYSRNPTIHHSGTGKVTHEFNYNIRLQIMPNIQRLSEENINVDAQNLLPHLPIERRRDIKRNLCLPMLKKVSDFLS